MNINKNQKGFSVVTGLLMLIGLGVAIGIGFYIYSVKNKSTVKSEPAKISLPQVETKPITQENETRTVLGGDIASVVIGNNWKVFSKIEPCKFSTGAIEASDHTIAVPNCISQLSIGPNAVSHAIGSIYLISTSTKSLQDILSGMACSGIPAAQRGNYQVTAGYEAAYCTLNSIDTGLVGGRQYAVRKGQNVVYLSFSERNGSGNTYDSSTHTEKIIPAEDFSKYRAVFEEIVKSVQFK